MKIQSQQYLERLKNLYTQKGTHDDLLALADVEKADERVRELKIYREQPITQEIIEKALSSFRDCVEQLSNPAGMQLTEIERAYLFAKMDWCRFTLDIVGENPDKAEEAVDEIILNFAKKAGLST